MSAQTPIELIKELEAHFNVELVRADSDEEDYWNGDNFSHHYRKFNDDIYTVEEVEQVGGENEGSLYYYVFKITKHERFHGSIGSVLTKFIKFQGSYDSWNDSEWLYSPRYVVPAERVVIVYVDEK